MARKLVENDYKCHIWPKMLAPPPKQIWWVYKKNLSKLKEIKVVQNCMKWQENWSKTIFGPPPQKNRVAKKKLSKMRKIKVGQNCLIVFDPKFVWPEFCRPNFCRHKFFSNPKFFQTQHFFRSKFFGPQIFSDPHWEILTLSFVWRIKGKLECGSAQLNLLWIFFMFQTLCNTS